MSSARQAVAAVAAALIAPLALGQSTTPPSPSSPRPRAAAPASAPASVSTPVAVATASAAEGATLATQGAAGVAPCASCHGAQGEGNAAAGFPRLAGQFAPYLQRQLDAYAGDSRTNAVMQPIAKALTAAQRAAAAAYYASLSSGGGAATPTRAASSAAAGALGKSIATVGIDARTVQACANCHGPQGIGEWAIYPALAGQHATYLAAALAEWKSGARRTDPSGQMPHIAKALSDAEAKAVVAYYAALPAPSMPQSMPSASGSGASSASTRNAVVSGPGGAARNAPAQGVGTEQGAPLSGGTQGTGSVGNPTGPPSGAPTGASAPAATARPGAPATPR